MTDYLAWQASLVRSHARKGQFVTQNFDLDWRGYSYGVQPAVDQFAAAAVLDVAGIDIYHPTQDHLTGAAIAFGGDVARSMRGGQNYLVIETQAQGFPEWTPYRTPNDFSVQPFASGEYIEYRHWEPPRMHSNLLAWSAAGFQATLPTMKRAPSEKILRDSVLVGEHAEAQSHRHHIATVH